METVKTLGLLEGDPHLAFKLKAAAYLGLNARVLAAPVLDAAGGLLDCTFSAATADARADRLLVAPSALADACLAANIAAIPALPLRQWGIALKARQLREGGTCGEICSLRFSWLEPRAACAAQPGQACGIGSVEDAVAGLLDCAAFIAGAETEEVHIERVPGEPLLFALARLAGNVAVEIELNFALPQTAKPIRQLRANFSEGIVSNMPVVGLHNEEGAYLADASGEAQLVVDDENAPSFDEFENLYWKMLNSIGQGEPQAAAQKISALARAVLAALASDCPAAVERAEGGAA